MLPMVDGIIAFTVVFEGPGFFPERIVIHQEHATFAARGHDLVLAEGKGRCMPETANRTRIQTDAALFDRNSGAPVFPPTLTPAVVNRAMGLGEIREECIELVGEMASALGKLLEEEEKKVGNK